MPGLRSKFVARSAAASRNAASCAGGIAFDPDLRDRRHVDARHRNVPACAASSRSRSISCSASRRMRIVSLHAQHEVDAALQIETQLELFLLQPRW